MPGLPNTRVVHPRWQSHHHPVTESAMGAECTITRPATGTPTFNEATATTVYPTSADIYEGECRITRAQAQATVTVTADRPLMAAEYLVAIPASANLVHIGDVVTVIACDGDPDLVGLVLVVTNARRGSLTWQRDLICELQPPPTTR